MYIKKTSVRIFVSSAIVLLSPFSFGEEKGLGSFILEGKTDPSEIKTLTVKKNDGNLATAWHYITASNIRAGSGRFLAEFQNVVLHCVGGNLDMNPKKPSTKNMCTITPRGYEGEDILYVEEHSLGPSESRGFAHGNGKYKGLKMSTHTNCEFTKSGHIVCECKYTILSLPKDLHFVQY